MVQREIAERLRAAPGTREYGAPSVLAQLACDVTLVRTVDPAVFTPRPRVGIGAAAPGSPSAPARLTACGSWCARAFAHRRKSLARSLELVSTGPARGRRARRSRSSACPPTRGPSRCRRRSSRSLWEALR